MTAATSVLPEPQVPDPDLDYCPSATAEDFILSVANGPRNEFRVLNLMGSKGEGKTVAALYAIVSLAQRLIAEGLEHLLPIRVAVVRDTWVNLRRALSVESLVLTPAGWVKAGDVSVGDTLISQDGSTTRVLGVYPQGEQQLWGVQFSDGSSARVTGDHLWAVQGRWDREQPGPRNRRCPRGGWLPGVGGLRIVRTDQLRERLQRSRRRQKAWSIPLVEPVRFPSRPVPIDAYVLGVLLGDGGISNSGIRLSTADSEIVGRVRSRLPVGSTIIPVKGTKYDYAIRGLGRGRRHPVKAALLELGLLGLKSPEKFVPEAYLWNDQSTRLELLRGLVDTDGNVNRDRHVSFCSTSERLIEGVEFLVRSLGGLTKRSRREYGPDEGHRLRGHWVCHRHPAWSLAIQMPPIPSLVPVALPRKAQALKGRSRQPYRWVTSIKAEGHGPAVCFKVDHPSGLFVMNDFIVTHNTTLTTFEKAVRQGFNIAVIEGGREATMPPYAHFHFFGIDNRLDVNKLAQGFECGVLWLEEVAPSAELDGGIPADTFGAGATSVRQMGIPKRVILTMNPPDEDHWAMRVEEELEQRGLTGLIYHRFTIPPGEKSAHFRVMARRAAYQGDSVMAAKWQSAAEEFDDYRARNEVFLEAIGRGDLVERLVHGRVGGVAEGESIVGSFDYANHVTQPGEILIPLPGEEMWRAWDGGLTPSTVWCGVTAAGNLNVYGSRTSVNKAMTQHIIDEVVPFQGKRHVGEKINPGPKPILRPPGLILQPPRGDGYGKGQRMWTYQDIGDPTLFERDKVKNAETSAGQEIQNLLHTSLIRGRIEWGTRREAGNMAFWRSGATRTRPRLIRIQRDENSLLIKGLNGRAHYAVDFATGRINPSVEAAKRVSGLYFQALDALIYLLAEKFPAQDWRKEAPPPRKKRDGPPNWAAV